MQSICYCKKVSTNVITGKGKLALDFFAVGTCNHPPLCLYYHYWYAINCCHCSHTNIYAGAMNIVQYYSKKISPTLIAMIHSCCNGGTCVATDRCNGTPLLQQIIAMVCLCCNKSLQWYACVATNRCSSPAPVLQWCARVARNHCIKPLQHAFMLQQIDATECCCSIICCNVCIATHFTVNDATCIDSSYC